MNEDHSHHQTNSGCTRLKTMEGGDETNWSELVEDLVDGGDVLNAISLLESVVSNLQTDSLQLSSALFDLSKLYSSQGFSLKADEARTRALLLREQYRSTQGDVKTAKDDASVHRSSSGEKVRDPLELKDDVFLCKDCSDEDDWEAIADNSVSELRLSPKALPEVSKLSLDDAEAPTLKRRGRGTFAYKKEGLYSDLLSDKHPKDDDSESQSPEKDSNTRNLKYGTSHILVLADLPLSTTTRDLEKLLDNFKNSGVEIRWVNDTVALAVFRTSSLALEAFNCMKCAFSVRVLEEDDALLSSIRHKDLDPPRQRPQTSTRTAQRLIAQGMGLKLQSTNFGSKELREQEEARKNRIISRQQMKEDAWGDD